MRCGDGPRHVQVHFIASDARNRLPVFSRRLWALGICLRVRVLAFHRLPVSNLAHRVRFFPGPPASGSAVKVSHGVNCLGDGTDHPSSSWNRPICPALIRDRRHQYRSRSLTVRPVPLGEGECRRGLNSLAGRVRGPMAGINRRRPGRVSAPCIVKRPGFGANGLRGTCFFAV